MNPGWKSNYARYKSLFLNISKEYQGRPDIKVYLEFLLSLLTITILGVFALRPTLITIGKLYKEISSKETTIKLMDQKIQNIKEADVQYRKQKETIDLIYSSIPVNPNLDDVVHQAYGYSITNSVQITGLSTGQVTLKETDNKPVTSTADTFSLSLTSDGTYTGLISFLNDIGSLRRPVKDFTARISSSVSKDGIKSLSLGINGDNIYLKDTSHNIDK